MWPVPDVRVNIGAPVKRNSLACGFNAVPIDDFTRFVALQLSATKGPIFGVRHLGSGTATATLAPVENHALQ
jgi:hypothetical protein